MKYNTKTGKQRNMPINMPVRTTIRLKTNSPLAVQVPTPVSG